jgi:hypothetical protein
MYANEQLTLSLTTTAIFAVCEVNEMNEITHFGYYYYCTFPIIIAPYPAIIHEEHDCTL